MPDTSLRVLVVDDDLNQSRALAQVLRREGYETHELDYAKDCMEAVERLRPEALLLDLSMPGMTGFDIAEEISHNPDLRPVRLIAVTACDTEADRRQTGEHGFDYHLAKPVDIALLRTILEEIRSLRA